MFDKSQKIILGTDHAGYKIKEFIKENLKKDNYIFDDIGVFSEESMDYPDIAHPLAEAVSKGEYKFGILICGSGNGMAMAANRHKSVRAALCWNVEIIKLARSHNDANILVLPGRYLEYELACDMIKVFLETAFEGGRHIRRAEKIDKY